VVAGTPLVRRFRSTTQEPAMHRSPAAFRGASPPRLLAFPLIARPMAQFSSDLGGIRGRSFVSSLDLAAEAAK
jgi:hypothetical protein